MKTKNLLIALISFALLNLQFGTLNCKAQTSVPGGVVNGTWTLAGSPYNVQGSIEILNGDSLIIQPGVTVNFQGTYKFLILGKLKAIGTIADTITFTAGDTTNGWKGIRFDNTSITNDTSKIIYCKLQYGKSTGSSPDDRGGAFYFKNFSKASISNCRILNCKADYAGGGIYSENGCPKITNNIIYNNTGGSEGGGGIYCNNNNNCAITNNIINYNKASGVGGAGINCWGDSGLVISNNIISNNTGHGIVCANNPIISNNTISNNYGGGIGCNYSSNPNINYNTIINNTGGGIGCQSYYSPSIKYNTISNNTGGGGIYCNSVGGIGGGPVISNNIISNNNNSSDGGGIYCFTSGGGSVTISSNTISNNSGGNGGGIAAGGIASSISIFNNIISSNTALGGQGGGISCGGDSSLVIFNNTISNNTASSISNNNSGGGGIYCGGNPKIFNNIISNNTASGLSTNGGGGGIYCNNGNPNIFNNTITNNTVSSGNGGAINIFYQSSPVFTNNTVINNAVSGASGKGGALYLYYNCNPIFRNCIFFDNISSIGNTVFIEDEASDPEFLYCNVQGGSAAFELNGNFYTGAYQNNIDTNALFVSPSAGSGTGFNGITADWSLQQTSPCINTGDPNATYPANDIAGNPRVSSGRIDIGAYEFQGALSIASNKNSTAVNLYPNPSAGKFNIQATNENCLIEIYNLLGEKIYTQNGNTQPSKEINITGSPKGIYFVKISDTEKSHTEKIIIQ